MRDSFSPVSLCFFILGACFPPADMGKELPADCRLHVEKCVPHIGGVLLFHVSLLLPSSPNPRAPASAPACGWLSGHFLESFRGCHGKISRAAGIFHP